MLEETETEETVNFFVTFFLLVAFQLATPMRTALFFELLKFCWKMPETSASRGSVREKSVILELGI